jgi:hypothetical protein
MDYFKAISLIVAEKSSSWRRLYFINQKETSHEQIRSLNSTVNRSPDVENILSVNQQSAG